MTQKRNDSLSFSGHDMKGAWDRTLVTRSRFLLTEDPCKGALTMHLLPYASSSACLIHLFLLNWLLSSVLPGCFIHLASKRAFVVLCFSHKYHFAPACLVLIHVMHVVIVLAPRYYLHQSPISWSSSVVLTAGPCIVLLTTHDLSMNSHSLIPWVGYDPASPWYSIPYWASSVSKASFQTF